ncbi:hypothetical protein AYL99_05158 [Fonsecaea erecta]|uniref:Uncharacterized protein n=1 Tax=Fonsecaea erecta TaxID=1367422 RepID=A0A178ZL69_9EURO|nr:hypothetical protein AYL99_05158 [Fonsecaea erecta]OAP60156.1 hypothetical protein AYL99_05158 [Fonsecaea erecta]
MADHFHAFDNECGNNHWRRLRHNILTLPSYELNKCLYDKYHQLFDNDIHSLHNLDDLVNHQQYRSIHFHYLDLDLIPSYNHNNFEHHINHDNDDDDDHRNNYSYYDNDLYNHNHNYHHCPNDNHDNDYDYNHHYHDDDDDDIHDVINDGSFEDVDAGSIGVADATSGEWSVSGAAVFTQNTGSPYDTPDGSKYVYFTGTPGSISTVSQNLTELVPNSDYTLTFDYAVPVASNPNLGSGNDFSQCALQYQIGDSSYPDQIDYYGSQPSSWGSAPGLAYTVDCSEVLLTLIWDCSQLLAGDEIDFAIDNIDFTGGQCFQAPV